MNCPCHGVPKGYRGQCRVRKRTRDNAYLLTEKGRARARRFRLREATSQREAAIQLRKELLT